MDCHTDHINGLKAERVLQDRMLKAIQEGLIESLTERERLIKSLTAQIQTAIWTLNRCDESKTKCEILLTVNKVCQMLTDMRDCLPKD